MSDCHCTAEYDGCNEFESCYAGALSAGAASSAEQEDPFAFDLERDMERLRQEDIDNKDELIRDREARRDSW